MRRIALKFAALALPSAAIPASAEEPLTQDQMVDCAVFAAAFAGSVADQQMQAGAGFFMTWLVGLYEGETGQRIDETMKRRSIELTPDDFAKLQPGCSARMIAFGQRLSKLGAEITALEKAAAK